VICKWLCLYARLWLVPQYGHKPQTITCYDVSPEATDTIPGLVEKVNKKIENRQLKGMALRSNIFNKYWYQCVLKIFIPHLPSPTSLKQRYSLLLNLLFTEIITRPLVSNTYITFCFPSPCCFCQ